MACATGAVFAWVLALLIGSVGLGGPLEARAQLAAAENHSCATLPGGALKCWGANGQGQLGLGDTEDRGDEAGEMGDNLPAVNLGSNRTATQVVAGTDHTCAVLDNDEVKCWGRNDSGQLGYGDEEDRGDEAGEMGDNLPAVDLGTGSATTQVAAGREYTCALLDGGTVKCWGNNSSGQLGYGDTAWRGNEAGEMGDNLPAVNLGTDAHGNPLTATEIASGAAHTCARLSNDEVKCWGDNDSGQLGYADTEERGEEPNEMGDYLSEVPLTGYARRITGFDGTGDADDGGWRLLGVPAAGVERAALEDDLDFTSIGQGNLVHTWDGGAPDAWNAATSSSDPLPWGEGFILFVFDDNIDLVNEPGLQLDVPSGSEDLTADKTVSGLDDTNQYHLLGNPYEEAFDLSSLVDASGTTFSSAGFQAAVLVRDPSGSGSWTTITEGTSFDDVASWQGFFVERSPTGQGPTSLTFEAAGKQGGAGDLIGNSNVTLAGPGETKTPSATLELGLTVTSGADTLAGDVVKALFIEGANSGWDAYEASQLPPPNASSYAALSSPIERGGDLTRRLQASRAYPTTADTITVPLSVRSVQVSGTARLGWPEEARSSMPDDWAVVLEDTETGDRADLLSPERIAKLFGVDSIG